MDICQIRIYDRNLDWLGQAQSAESVQFERELTGFGRFEIHIHPDKPGARELACEGNIITLNSDGSRAGIITDFCAIENRKSCEYVIYGTELKGVFSRRIVVPPTKAEDANAYGWERVMGAAETVMKHYVRRNVVSPTNAERIIPHLVIAPDLRRGIQMPWQARYTLLSDELKGIGEYAKIGHSVSVDAVGKEFVFDCIVGTDRSVSQSVVSPVTFCLEYGNIKEYRYTEDKSNFCNTGYAGGAGIDENRLIYVLNPENAGFMRREVFLECSGASDIDELIYYGAQKLSAYEAVKTLDDITDPKVFMPDVDFFLGDIVTVKLDKLNLSFDTPVMAIRDIWEPGKGYRREIRLGKRLPDLFTFFGQKPEIR